MREIYSSVKLEVIILPTPKYLLKFFHSLTAVVIIESTKKSTTILIHLAWFDSTG